MKFARNVPDEEFGVPDEEFGFTIAAGMGAAPINPSDELASPAVIHALPFGVVVVGDDGEIVGANAVARELLPRLPSGEVSRCEELFDCSRPGGPCEHGCLAKRAASSGEALPEVRIDTEGAGGAPAVWVTASPLRHRPGAILHLRPGQAGDRRRRTDPHWISGPELRITSLGRTGVASSESELGGDWLRHRAGQLLKYLVCERQRLVHGDEIAEALWPGSGRQGLNSVRHFVHRLRDTLEPHRTGRGQSSFVIALGGGYELDRRRVRIDADEFERAVHDGLVAMERLETEHSQAAFMQAMELYRGAFLEDEPYAEWAYAERDRLGALAARALRALLVLERGNGNDAAIVIEHLRRLVELEPLDSGINRELISTLLAGGRYSEASRRYKAFSRRLVNEFGAEPAFDLADLAPQDFGA